MAKYYAKQKEKNILTCTRVSMHVSMFLLDLLFCELIIWGLCACPRRVDGWMDGCEKTDKHSVMGCVKCLF